MKIINYNGDIFNSTADIICHQVNSFGQMGSGIAKQVKEKYPRVFEKYYESFRNNTLDLGTCQVVATTEDRKQFIANLCGQKYFGSIGRFTNYEGIYVALEKLASYCERHNTEKVAFPYHMSCDRGGGSWSVIMAMIEDVFKNNDNITIEIWKYDKG